MTVDRLWAPWRINYIKKAKNKKEKCIFCQNLISSSKNQVIFKTKHSIAILNIFPYNNGHLMISPIRHTGKISDLTETETVDLIRCINRAIVLLDKILKPEGYNIGINISRSAGAGITGHLHIHIVPRWQGDSNFMPVIYNTKVICQSLKELRKQLINADTKRNKIPGR